MISSMGQMSRYAPLQAGAYNGSKTQAPAQFNFMFDFLAAGTMLAAAVAFVAGLLITAVSGSARLVKIFLGLVGIITLAGLAGGVIYSHGLLFYLLRHSKPVGLSLATQELNQTLGTMTSWSRPGDQ